MICTVTRKVGRPYIVACSQPQVWPFAETDGKTIDCRSFKYRNDDEPLGARYRSRHYKTLIAATRRAYTKCRLGDTRRFIVTYDDGSACSGWLTQDDQVCRDNDSRKPIQ